MNNLLQSKKFKIGLLVLVVAALFFMLMLAVKDEDGTFFEGGSSEQTTADKLDKASEKEDKGEQVILLPKEDIYKFSITDANGIVLNFERNDEEWIYTDNTKMDISEDRIDKVLNYLSDVRCTKVMTDVNGEDYGLSQLSTEYRITDSSDSTIIISVGNTDEASGDVYFSINYDFSTVYVNSGKLAKISEYAIQDLMQL